MNDLISRQAAIDAIKRYESADSYDLNNGLILAMNAVADVPTIEPKKGKWIYDDEGYHCSECLFHAYGNTLECYDGAYKYCPHCGARVEVDSD